MVLAIQKPAAALAPGRDVLHVLRWLRRVTTSRERSTRHSKKRMAPARSNKCLRLCLDTHDVVFRRSHRDGQKQLVCGDVVFCAERPTTIRSVKVSLHGVRKVNWLTNTLQPQQVRQKETIFFQEQPLLVFAKGAGHASKAGPGLYTWPFTFTLPSSLPESIPWLPLDTYIRYSVTAEISIGSSMMLNTRTLRTSEPLRLVKSPSFFIDELQLAPDLTQQTAQLSLPAARLDATISLPQPYQPTDNGDGVLEATFALSSLLNATATATTTKTTPSRPITLALELLQTVHLVVKDKHGEPHRGTKDTQSVATVSRTVEGRELEPAVVMDDDGTELRNGGGGGGCSGCGSGKDGGGGSGGSTSDSGSTTPTTTTTTTTTTAPRAKCFGLKLPLPMAPYALVQSVHVGEGIRVRYTLRAKVSVEGGESQEEQEQQYVDLFPKLFVPVCERQAYSMVSPSSISRGSGVCCDTDIVDEYGVVTSLPSYGEHLFDPYFCWDAQGLTANDILHNDVLT